MKTIDPPAMPVLMVGPIALTTSPNLERNMVAVKATQQVRIRLADDWLSMTLEGIRGRIHSRIEDRQAAHVQRAIEAWNDELMEALGDVLAAEEADRRQALLDLAATATEALIAADYDRITTKEKP